MNFLVDNQLPLKLARHLTMRGHDARHVLDIGLERADDPEVWARAAADGCAVFSKDEDFVFLANRPGDTGQLVWVRIGNCRNAALLAAIDRVLDAIVAALTSGQRIVEVR